MDVKEIADVTPIAVVQTAPVEPAPPPAPEVTGQNKSEETGISALRPVIQIDTSGLAVLQLQEAETGEVVLQVPSEEATRQYRERENQGGRGQAPVEHMAAAASGSVAAAAAAAAVMTPPPSPPPQPVKGAELPQAVKSVEPEAGSKKPGSVRVNA